MVLMVIALKNMSVSGFLCCACGCSLSVYYFFCGFELVVVPDFIAES